jgi:hypothetical protein
VSEVGVEAGLVSRRAALARRTLKVACSEISASRTATDEASSRPNADSAHARVTRAGPSEAFSRLNRDTRLCVLARRMAAESQREPSQSRREARIEDRRMRPACEEGIVGLSRPSN